MRQSALDVILKLGPKYGLDLWDHCESFRVSERDNPKRIWRDAGRYGPKAMHPFPGCEYRIKEPKPE